MTKKSNYDLNLDLTSLKAHANFSAGLLALDFGTAFSKACVRKGGFGGSVVPLELGLISGGSSGSSAQPNPYVLASTIFVDEGRFLFGPSAYSAGLNAPAGRRRFDSPKLLFNKDDLSALMEKPVSSDMVPGAVTFTEYDLILLYLGYFTSMVGSALQRYDLNRHLPRRFAVPGWTPFRAKRYAAQLFELLASAQVLADTFGGRWEQGLPIEDVRKAIDQILDLSVEQLPLKLVDMGMHEASAAGACIFNPRWRTPRLFIVIDVGAGTIDFGGFVLFRPLPRRDQNFKLAQLRDTSLAVEYGGNYIDECLTEIAIQKSSAPEHQRSATFRSLRRQARESKEALFRDGYIDLEIIRTEGITIYLDDLLNSQNIKYMEKTLKSTFEDLIGRIGIPAFERHSYHAEVYITGGGARLPFVSAMLETPFRYDRRSLKFTKYLEAPKWMAESNAEWLPYFSQLAIAIGATSEEVPDDAGPYSSAALAPGPRVVARPRRR
ncbi:MAG: hypothetical protein WBX25_37325 [Rhodomicrobium sp.]